GDIGQCRVQIVDEHDYGHVVEDEVVGEENDPAVAVVASVVVADSQRWAALQVDPGPQLLQVGREDRQLVLFTHGRQDLRVEYVHGVRLGAVDSPAEAVTPEAVPQRLVPRDDVVHRRPHGLTVDAGRDL